MNGFPWLSLCIACAALKGGNKWCTTIKGFVKRTNIHYMLYVRTRNLSAMDWMASDICLGALHISCRLQYEFMRSFCFSLSNGLSTRLLDHHKKTQKERGTRIKCKILRLLIKELQHAHLFSGLLLHNFLRDSRGRSWKMERFFICFYLFDWNLIL